MQGTFYPYKHGLSLGRVTFIACFKNKTNDKKLDEVVSVALLILLTYPLMMITKLFYQNM